MKKLLILGAAAMILAACQKDNSVEGTEIPAPESPHIAADDPAVSTTPEGGLGEQSDEGEVAPASAIDVSGLPHVLDLTTDAVEATASIEDDLFDTFPVIAKEIHATAKQDFDAFVKLADTEMAAGGSFRTYSYSDDWKMEAVSGDLISIRRDIATYTGGAHGNYGSQAYLFDQKNGETLAFSSLFIDPKSALAADRDHIIDALADQKIKAGYAEIERDMLKGELRDALPLETLMNAKMLLLSSDAPGKFGGYMLIFDPYEIGAYAEGQYEAIVPQTYFRSALKPEYQGLFGGEPTAN